ncbi:DMT family transporter [Microaerobacter geothermalis]|uniref:DMT family transporter n=1 Tax=Microaerobacter geothermalis TaxID=674972 RepID=UPI001F33C8A4|nr:DMT family transporter [Microaerobacter geothermalis]MCF6093636.1 DMT family transporter [Microaerobacter geothermalis]
MLKSPYVLLVLATLFWGGNFTVGKYLVSYFPPVTMSVIRWTIAFLVMLPFAWKEFWIHRKIFLEQWKITLALAATGIAAFNALAYASMQYTTAINASLMNSMTPIFVIILSLLFLRERLSLYQLMGVILSMVGVLWIITKGNFYYLMTLQFNRGDLFMLAAIFSWSIYSVLTKKWGKMFPLKGTFLITMFLGIGFLLPFLWGEWDKIPREGISLSQIFSLAYISIFPSILSFICWNKAVMMAGPSKASIFLNLIVVFASVFSIIFLEERIGSPQIIGGTLVITGVYLSQRRGKRTLATEANSFSDSKEKKITMG